MCALLEETGLALRGVFLNAAKALMQRICAKGVRKKKLNSTPLQTNETRNNRKKTTCTLLPPSTNSANVIERANAWPDGFKTLRVRYEGKLNTWMAAHFMAFVVLLLKTKLNC